MIKVQKFPPAPYKRFGSFGIGIMFSNDSQFSGISVLLGFWQINISPFFDAMVLFISWLVLLVGLFISVWERL